MLGYNIWKKRRKRTGKVFSVVVKKTEAGESEGFGFVYFESFEQVTKVMSDSDHDPVVPSMPSDPQPITSPLPTGPRPAPTYSLVNAVIEKKEDGPGSRCGRTLTAVNIVGEEGSQGYIGPRLILFGGATALEGNSAAPPSTAGSAGIRLAGATADVHCYDVLTNKWSRLTPLGEPPSPRAAHVATAVGTMVVIQKYMVSEANTIFVRYAQKAERETLLKLRFN